jgi:predicted aminopeptidase
VKAALLLSALLVLAGCSHISYYAQAINGQLEIGRKAAPIDEVLADPATDQKVAEKLQLVRRARSFASQELGLPANATFQSYANLHRPFVVWNVFAAPEFSVTPMEWCFPIAGCVAYRGYFSEAAAQEAGAELRAEGLDVFVAGIPVYSTLGWFDDPVLNTFIGYPEAELVGILFHELAHQVVYVPGDSVFNESFATSVEEEGVRRWFERANDPAAYAAYRQAQDRKRAFTGLLVRTRDRLAAVYEQPESSEQRKQGKARILEEAKNEYAVLKQGWGGYAGYDKWFTETPLNNAKLVSATLYADRVPAFSALLAQAAGDLPRFYETVRALAQLPMPEREARLFDAEGKLSAAAF